MIKYLIITVVVSLVGPAQAAGSENCKELPGHLEACTPFVCEYDRLVSNESAKKIATKYEILGRDEEDSCVYKASVDGNVFMRCNLLASSVPAFSSIFTMQQDGRFQRNTNKLKAAVAKGDFSLNGIDPEFIEVSAKFNQIVSSECE